MSNRPDGRALDELRPLKIMRGYMTNAEGSALIEMGETKVICTASVEKRVPPFLVGKGTGWLTAEYAMLPRSTHSRTQRETRGAKGRTQEIQRLIGRSLRAVVNLDKLGVHTLWIDCDVLQADGGTRTASISGAYIAVADALSHMRAKKMIDGDLLLDSIAAVSVGIIDNAPRLDLCYAEDSAAEVDMNIVMTGSNRFIELQGTAEGDPFDQEEMDAMLSLGKQGIQQIKEAQEAALASALV
jgi:ribonuclease PH